MRIKPVAIVLVVVALVLFVIGIIYLTTTAPHLPGFIPGKPTAKELKLQVCTSTIKVHCRHLRKFTKRGIAAIGLGVVVLVGAWYTSGLRKSSSHSAAA